MKTLTSLYSNLKDKVNTATLKPFVMLNMTALSTSAAAQDAENGFKVPKVTLPGVNESSSPLDMFLAIIKYLFLFASWIFVIFMAFTVLKTVIKEFNKVRRDEETAIGDIVGKVVASIGGLLFVVVFVGWLTAYLA
ncbi:hypothetical protein [Marinagarivorans cellulosilyticus]|uniref:Uncharacterized protein n=1 Tax=Marinagarivorans cellulosilyticus TaxID=2721545 RepID=A0AAN1WHL9_9GAMM|nr:hypothetical protein [Marinagarivorans cellulosilyticus]BCD97762.1 hypothetical protein MARGE09_P1963 [Marinagarivorans cellulosilyticus]